MASDKVCDCERICNKGRQEEGATEIEFVLEVSNDVEGAIEEATDVEGTAEEPTLGELVTIERKIGLEESNYAEGATKEANDEEGTEEEKGANDEEGAVADEEGETCNKAPEEEEECERVVSLSYKVESAGGEDSSKIAVTPMGDPCFPKDDEYWSSLHAVECFVPCPPKFLPPCNRNHEMPKCCPEKTTTGNPEKTTTGNPKKTTTGKK